MATETAYNSRDVSGLHHHLFKTPSSEFFFDQAGRFYFKGQHEGHAAEGRIPEAVASVDQKYREKVQLFFAGHQRAGLIQFLEEVGEEPQIGKMLVLALNKEDAKRKDRIGFYSESLEVIE